MTTNNVEKFKVGYHHSNGLGNVSNESERVVNIEELKNMFDDFIIECVEKWINGDTFEVEKELSEDELLTIRATSYGTLIIKSTARYRAGGYDDSPVYRDDDDIYEIYAL